MTVDPPAAGHEGGDPPRHETEAHRLDRNIGEQLQELRVAQTGVQILFAFLLTLVFQQRFAELDDLGRGVYLGALACALLATGFLIAPVGYHRLVFRRAMKDEVVEVTNGFALAGLGFLSLALGGALTVILDVMFDPPVAVAGGAGAVVFLVVLWFLIPWLRVRAKRDQTGIEDH
jgi:hypothetical protein